MQAPASFVATIGIAAVVLLALAWLIGVQGMLELISNYRRHPEEYPDGAALGRWMAWTLAAGGASMGLAALSVYAGAVSVGGGGLWAGATGAAVAATALRGVVKFRRKAPAPPPAMPPGSAGRR